MMKYKQLVPFGIAIFAVAGLLLNSGSFTSASQANKFSESPFLLGHLELVAKDKDGNIKAYRQTDNIVVNKGKNCAAVHIFGVPANSTGSACGGQSTAAFNYIGIGTNGAAETATDNALGTPLGSRTNNGTFTLVNATNGGSDSSPYYILQSQFHPGVQTITESGIFDASSNGHMFAHKTFTGIGMGATDTLTLTWRVTLS